MGWSRHHPLGGACLEAEGQEDSEEAAAVMQERDDGDWWWKVDALERLDGQDQRGGRVKVSGSLSEVGGTGQVD